jgi:hypothetical protein
VYIVVVHIAIGSIAAEDHTGPTSGDLRVQRHTTARAPELSV